MEANNAFPNLLATHRVGSLVLRNRMVMPAMVTNYATGDGSVSQRLIDYYEARAAGGVGLLIVEIACVDFPYGKGALRQLNVDADKYLPGLGDLAGAVKRHGVPALLQLHHAGREASLAGTGAQPVAPSAIPSVSPKAAVPRALGGGEIQELVGRFVDAAARAVRAGFDGVELHGGHGYLLAQFLSPLANVRTDDYGGTLENRARLLLEVVRGIRQRLGPRCALSVRLSGDELVAGGITIEETCRVAQMLQAAEVDVIDVSIGGATTPKPVTIAPAAYPSGYQLHLPARVMEEVTVPVIGVGRLNTPARAEEALRDGKCDLVALGRALIADPEFPKKAAAGRADEIRPCTACMHCIHSVMFEDGGLVCGNNPAAGRERELALDPALVSKKVFVVGGGIAGMEAARVAALRGHDVTLFEQSDQLGGQLVAAAMPPHKQELNLLREYYVAQMAKTGVTARLGVAPAAATIAAAGPDAVIVATGGAPERPLIPGSDRPHVVLAEDVLLGKVEVGPRVVVIGGELVGCETAEYLADQGKRVTIARRGPRLAAKMLPVLRRQLLDRLAELKVVALTGIDYQAIDERGVVIVTGDGSSRLLEADTVVIAAGSKPVADLATELRGQVPRLEVIGDAVAPRRFLEAIQDGMMAGATI